MARPKAPVNKAKAFLDKNKLGEYTTMLNDASSSEVKSWISSGSYSLNRVLSGSYYKGFADNRMYVLAGPSKSGKSLVAGCTARNAQQAGFTVVYYDSENAIDPEGAKRLGIDVDSMIYVPIGTISEFRNHAVSLIMKWREEYGQDEKLLLICDSLGGMSGTKESKDIEEGKNAMDMGQRAKELRSTARALTQVCGKYRVPLICTNHTYEQAAANPQAAPITKMTGGEGFMYAASGVIYFKSRGIREQEKNASGDTIKVKTGNILVASSEKNRFVPEGTKGELYLDFNRGLSKYYGLLDEAIEFGFFEKKGPRIEVKHLGKSVFEKNVYNKECFGPIIDELNLKVEEKFKFASLISETEEIMPEDDGDETEEEGIDKAEDVDTK